MSIELGFTGECEFWQVESRLFPSKVGGKPAWLNLENLPNPVQLQCSKCQQTMIFLCQIYAPYEEGPEISLQQYINNFHRTLFVFVCRNSQCSKRNNSANVKVFRNSLTRDNKFYSYDPPEEKPNPDFSLTKWVKLCNLCGILSEKQCSKCKAVHYCSREHQVIDWKEGHKKECGTQTIIRRQSRLLFSEMEIITEPEEIEEASINVENELQKFKNMEVEGKTGTMKDISETDLDAHATTEIDKVFTKFQKRISYNPDQVIRYKRGGEPLWIAKEPRPEDIPNCEYCGGPRWFEFQIMPQMLTILKEHDLDWGVLVAYTCINSCTDNNSYKEEYVFKQDVELNSI